MGIDNGNSAVQWFDEWLRVDADRIEYMVV